VVSTPARVPFVDLRRQHAGLAGGLELAFEELLGSSAFTLGEQVARFERDFADYVGVSHCVGVGSGTAALTLALKAAGIGIGDEVIVPAHTFVASALGVVHAGATPVFCDVEDATGLIDLDAAAAAIGPRTAALLPVHLYGQMCPMDAIGALAARNGLIVIEDAAQAHGAELHGRRAGAFGAAGCFSFYPSKNLGALGDGGAICTNDAALASNARALRNLGQYRKGEHLLCGYNERLDGLQAALLRVKLPHLDGWNDHRQAIAGVYRRGLSGGTLELLPDHQDGSCVYHLFPVRTEHRDRLAMALGRHGIATAIHYSPSVPRQSAFLAEHRGNWPVADAWAAQELSLPMFAELRDLEIAAVVRACREFAGSAPEDAFLEAAEY